MVCHSHALRDILTVDDLIKRNIILVSWCCMWKCSGNCGSFANSLCIGKQVMVLCILYVWSPMAMGNANESDRCTLWVEKLVEAHEFSHLEYIPFILNVDNLGGKK